MTGKTPKMFVQNRAENRAGKNGINVDGGKNAAQFQT